MRIIISAVFLATTCVFGFAQEKLTTPAPLITTEALTTITDPFLAMRIPLNSKIYIAPFKSEDATKPVEGFETYMAAALRKKGVPIIMVADRSQADFEIAGSADKKGAGWAKKWLLADFRRSTSASITVTNLNTSVVAYADSSDRSSANRGLRSSAEKLAKYLKRKIMDDEKKFAKLSAKSVVKT
jgi:hypothetical protein